jgi:hypothetical protein
MIFFSFGIYLESKNQIFVSASPSVEVGSVGGSGVLGEVERNQIFGRNTTTINGEIVIGRRQEVKEVQGLLSESIVVSQ